MYVFALSLLGFTMAHAVPVQQLTHILQKQKHPFSYNLDVSIIPGKTPEAGVMICCHGYGANNRIGQSVHSARVVQDHIISFNFPDYDLHSRPYDPHKSAFGSIEELLPLLYVLKKCVIEGELEKVNLYGFSAGGAAVINALVVLQETVYDHRLKEIGITEVEKKKISGALQKGLIILDCPLKSIEELIAARGSSPEFEIIAQRYKKNQMRPLDSVKKLEGVSLHILLHFQQPDEILGNRDDQLFIERLKQANKGITNVIIGHEGGHNVFHASLWKHYQNLLK